VATELGCALSNRGHEVHYISYDRPFRLAGCDSQVIYHEVEVPRYPLFHYPPYVLALTSKLVEVARYYRLDLLHAHYAIPHAAAAYLAKQCLDRPLPVVTTLHGTDISLLGSDRSLFDVTTFSINASDCVTAVSQALSDLTRTTFPVRREIEVIPNFIDPQVYYRRPDPALRRRFALAQEKIIVHVSNFRAVKRVAEVVGIFARVNQHVPCHLLMIGDGPDAGAARRRAAELGVQERVHFLGKQGDVIPYLSISDAMLLPSTIESFGLVALEAMACQVPVVVSRTGGLPEVVESGVSGYLVDVHDLGCMAERCISILSDDRLASRMGAAGRRRAEEAFSQQSVVTRYENLYRRLVDS